MLVPSKIRYVNFISTHAPAGGATLHIRILVQLVQFLLTPLREGRLYPAEKYKYRTNRFLLTPLREGRPRCRCA